GGGGETRGKAFFFGCFGRRPPSWLCSGESPAGRGGGGGEPLLFPVVAGAIPEPRAADAGGAVASLQVAVRVLADDVVDEQILGDDDVAFHPHHFGDVSDLSRSVAQAGRLHHHVDRRADHLPDRASRQGGAPH